MYVCKLRLQEIYGIMQQATRELTNYPQKRNLIHNRQNFTLKKANQKLLQNSSTTMTADKR
jgi:hypothetical protein